MPLHEVIGDTVSCYRKEGYAETIKLKVNNQPIVFGDNAYKIRLELYVEDKKTPILIVNHSATTISNQVSCIVTAAMLTNLVRCTYKRQVWLTDPDNNEIILVDGTLDLH